MFSNTTPVYRILTVVAYITLCLFILGTSFSQYEAWKAYKFCTYNILTLFGSFVLYAHRVLYNVLHIMVMYT